MARSFPTITRISMAEQTAPYRNGRRALLFLLAVLCLFVQQGWHTKWRQALTTIFPAAVVQAKASAAPLACQELLTNGDLESSGGWVYGATPAPGSVVGTPTHNGTFAVRLGIATGANALAYSTAYQSISLPAAATQIVLTYWEQPGTTGDSGDFRETLLLQPDFSSLRSLGRQTGAGNGEWAQRTVDISDLRGHSVVLYFNVYNNGTGATLVNYLDEISLQSCDSAATATPTLTPTALPTATSPAPTATATPQPNNVIVRVTNVAVAQVATTLRAQVDLLGATDTAPVGVLSIDVTYDQTLLNPTGCTVGSSFDLLLCNSGTPGLIQLAGVATSGIRTDVTIADLDFTIVQPDRLNTLLTVQIETVGDTEGAALPAIAQQGHVYVACVPGSEGCPILAPLYLPLVQR